MIIDSLTGMERYFSLNPRFEKVFRFLRSQSLFELAEGRYDIDENNIYMTVFAKLTKNVNDVMLETHDSYIDIQLLLEGSEIIGWRDRSRCFEISAPYDEANDIAFYAEESEVFVNLSPMNVAIIFPHDAHAPMIGDGNIVKKIVVKVKI